MKKLEITNKMSRAFHKAGFKIKKHSPEILIVAGVVGTITSTVMACKATTKLDGILEDTKDKVDKIKDAAEHPENFTEEYTVEDSKKDLAIVYTQTGLKIAKLYAPAVIIGTLSITSILTSHNIMRKRNAGLAAAYAIVDKGFKEYRGRVVERFGEELDKELRYGVKSEKIETIVTDENGNEKKVEKVVDVVDPNTISDYAKIWYEGNPGWTKDPELNLTYLKLQQAYANDKLKAQGYLFLNEVYEMLGFPKTRAGQVVGWVYDEENPSGDNFVDFGIYDFHDSNKIRFVNGEERSILLDFNVDGYINDILA